MVDLLKDRVAVITGAGVGIGQGIARRFAREGCKVVVAEWNDDTGAATAASLADLGGEGHFVHTDVTDKAQAIACVDAAIERWNRVDILINNAWSGSAGRRLRFEWKEDEDLRRAFEMGAMSAFWTMKAAFPHMRDAGKGSIINICSLNGVNAHMFTLEYNMAKEALRTMTRTAAVEWGRHNIRCNVICPGAATESSKAMAKNQPAMMAETLKANPMRRTGEPESDIGGAALLLCLDDAGYMNGNTLFVGGGTHINGVPWRMDIPDTLEEFSR
jgi:NAD(P)-dependent dehydrogenase (short-subunit alcohol dehydrogenase family)